MKRKAMKKRIWRYCKHIFATIIGLLLIGISVLVSLHGSIDYGHDPTRLNLDKEGPYLFYENDSVLNINYIRGNKTDGFTVESKVHPINNPILARCYFPLDSSAFDFRIDTGIEIPKTSYNDGQPILAVSDIESGYKTFRDFLMAHKVIDQQLRWTFGKGHLVLVGDFVDRGYSTTQVLWFIYKLEQDARKKGGRVHFILGNHELKNLQGKYESASPKYYGVASILGKQHHDLYGPNSFIGRWMASKNTIERINGILFTHGGIHPDVANYKTTLSDINRINRDHYRKPYFPKPEKSIEQLLLSTKTGICWYRGYFKDNLSQAEVEKGINALGAKAVVVGHTLQWQVNKKFDGKVFAIDVKHSKDYKKNWPNKKSEGLLIEKGRYYRLSASVVLKENYKIKSPLVEIIKHLIFWLTAMNQQWVLTVW
ncbi:MAG: metallophosphoesterase [Pricia sp.]